MYYKNRIPIDKEVVNVKRGKIASTRRTFSLKTFYSMLRDSTHADSKAMYIYIRWNSDIERNLMEKVSDEF